MKEACYNSHVRSATLRFVLALLIMVLVGIEAGSSAPLQSAPAPPAQGQGRLIVYGDIALFQPPGHPENCILRNRFKRGEPVGFRMFVADPSTGKREESAQLVVHVNVGAIGRRRSNPSANSGSPSGSCLRRLRPGSFDSA